MDAATGPLGSLLAKLGQLLQDEYNLQKGAKKDIDFLKKELESMHASLRAVGQVPLEQLSELARIWARDVRELAYDMEDIVDIFLVRVQGPEPTSKRSARRFIKKMTNAITKAMTRREIAQEIKDIKQRVKEVAERHDRYKVDTIASAKTTLVDPRVTALYTALTDLVGIDEAKDELIMRMTKEDGLPTQQQRIISIVGFGGLGKTTLAKAVYDELKPQFNGTAFVPVSRNPDTKKLLKDILYELDKGKYENIHSTMLEERQLIDKVREFLQNKRYIIVLDDMWSTEPWNMLRCALAENNMGSRIVTTTRIIDVAEEVGGYCYKLKPLTPANSKILFYRRIFGCEDKVPEQYSEVSKKILKKCGGVPLAIITTSGLLANKLGDVKEWSNLCDSIGSGIGNNHHDMENMNKILSLSYYDLPSHLKTCLLYLSVFPEDYEIGKERLIWRWVAEGFVQYGEAGQRLYEIGECYFNALVNRSLIQSSISWSGSSCCHVHDLVHDLICYLSREENFVTTGGLGDSNRNTSASGRKIHRLSLHYTTWSQRDMPEMNTSKLKSLTMFGPTEIISISSHPCYHLLRVLDLEDCNNLHGHPSLRFIGNLFHLRYLGLPSEVYTDELLEEIGKLRFLQTLDLTGAYRIGNELPWSILGLGQLMLLYVREVVRLPVGLRNLTSLEELRTVSVDSAQVAEELGHLTQLRELTVRLQKDKQKGKWDERLRTALAESLGKLHKLQRLILLNNFLPGDLQGLVEYPLGNMRDFTIDGIGLLPTWINPSWAPLVAYLEIRVSQVRRKDIQVLGMLQALRSLDLYVQEQDTPVLGRFMVGEDAFPCLESCEMYGFSVVPSMFPRGAMPRLEWLRFEIFLVAFSMGDEFTIDDDLALGHLPSLKEVVVVFRGDNEVRKDVGATKAKEKLRMEGEVHPNHISIRTY